MDGRTLTKDLGGRWYGRYGIAPCPVCQASRRPEQNALTLADSGGRLLLHCKKSHCDFIAILAAAGVTSDSYEEPDADEIARREAEEKAEAEKKERQAWRCWSDAVPIEGTVAEQYLRGRGITCPLPDSLRFHPSCWHSPTARTHPAMVARVDGIDGFAIHRTYLSPDGSKADVDGNKMMLGKVAGGAVRLTDPPDGRLIVAEGIETALSLASGLLRWPAITWAALSTSGMQRLLLPPQPGRLTIAPDGDAAGREAAHLLAEQAHGLGWEVSLLPAPEGCDWNDILMMRKAVA